MFQLPCDAQSRARFRRDGYVVVAESLDAASAADAAATADLTIGSAARTIDRRDRGNRLAYKVVTGDRIKSEAPALFDLYASPLLLEWVRHVTDCDAVSQSPHLQSAVNLNCLTAAGEQYPLHRDALPYTVLLFLSDVAVEAGGPFVIHSLSGRVVSIQPALGRLVLMDGARCDHGVAPLRRHTWRITMPMVFPGAFVERPDGLDDYLYRAEGARP
jgi:hypothetical protein